MYVFGHVGLTLGAAALGSGAFNFFNSLKKADGDRNINQSKPDDREDSGKADFLPGLGMQTLGQYLDIRFLIIGSMLPDIIDKPLGHIFFANGRVMSHTLLFTVVLLVVGFFLYLNHRNKWFLALGIGSFFHLMLDAMWATPRTLLWPLYGWSFPQLEVTNWIKEWVDHLNLPSVYVPELLGGAILIGFVVMIIYQKKTTLFLKRGTLKSP